MCGSRKYPYPPPHGWSMEIPRGWGGYKVEISEGYGGANVNNFPGLSTNDARKAC